MSLVHTFKPLPPPGTASPECEGGSGIITIHSYHLPAVPDMDICPSCYNMFIVPTPFVAKWKKRATPSNAACDMPHKYIRDLWRLTVQRSTPALVTLADRESHFKDFISQANVLIDQIGRMVREINALGNSISLEKLLVEHEKKLAALEESTAAQMKAVTDQTINVAEWEARGVSMQAEAERRLHDAAIEEASLQFKQEQLDIMMLEFSQLTGWTKDLRVIW